MYKFIIEFFKHPFTTGAIRPSSKYLAKEMIDNIDFDDCNNIVEYGAGTGVFTKEIIKRKKKSSKFLIIEKNISFYKLLMKKYSSVDNVYVINGEAENIALYMNQYGIKSIDIVFSGLPFTSMNKMVTNMILCETKKHLSKNGLFITFQYSLLKQKVFTKYFNIQKYKRVFLNLPPAYILTMDNNL